MTASTNTSPRALIRGQTLVLTLKDAVNPVVWQMDLTHVRSSALGVVAQGDNWQVRCKTDDGTTQDVAIYKNREQAVAVLTLVHDVLAENAGDAKDKAPDVTRPRHLLLSATSLVLLVVLSVVLMKLVPPPGARAASAHAKAAAPTAVGVPQNADDLLQGRGPAQ